MPKSLLRQTDPAPSIGLMLADVLLTTSTQTLCAAQLPAPGTYEVDLVMCFENPVLAATRNILLTPTVLQYAAFQSIALTRSWWRSAAAAPSVPTLQTANGQGLGVGIGTGAQRVRYHFVGLLVMNAPGVININANLDNAETCTARAGSYVRAQLRAAA